MAQASRVNLSDKIRAAIEAEIASGALAPGSRIEEQALMDRFSVSRTPAREAVLQLMSAGLVTLVPRQGAVVSGISLQEYVAMLEVLLELEGMAARLSARRMTLGQRRDLEKAAEACEAAASRNDSVGYAEVNRLFHEIIYDGSRNEVLARQLRAMRARMRHPQTSMFERPGRIRNSVAEHNGVLAAILAGDEDAAYRLMTGHISSGGNVYADAIATMTQPVVTDAAAPAAAAASAAPLSPVGARGGPKRQQP
ncbi:MAG: GntR family transcriptional regulator [Comamonadaceae bacterium]|nr:MAG: GntR family transcriptional regulator [Comamonadaceae bacterium]